MILTSSTVSRWIAAALDATVPTYRVPSLAGGEINGAFITFQSMTAKTITADPEMEARELNNGGIIYEPWTNWLLTTSINVFSNSYNSWSLIFDLHDARTDPACKAVLTDQRATLQKVSAPKDLSFIGDADVKYRWQADFDFAVWHKRSKPDSRAASPVYSFVLSGELGDRLLTTIVEAE